MNSNSNLIKYNCYSDYFSFKENLNLLTEKWWKDFKKNFKRWSINTIFFPAKWYNITLITFDYEITKNILLIGSSMLNNYSDKLNQYTKYTNIYIMMYMINFETARQDCQRVKFRPVHPSERTQFDDVIWKRGILIESTSRPRIFYRLIGKREMAANPSPTREEYFIDRLHKTARENELKQNWIARDTLIIIR